MAVAQTIADSLLKQLNRYSVSRAKPDPFTTVRLRKEIEKLSNVDPIGGLLCEAILLTFEDQYALVVEKFREIFKYLPEDADMHENFGNSLDRLNHMWEAHEQYLEALRYSQNPTSIIKDIAKSARVTFRTYDVIEALSHIKDTELLEKISEFEEIKEVLALHANIERLEVNPRDVASAYRLAEKICLDFKKDFPSGHLRHTTQYSGPKLTFYAEVDGSATDISEMNFALCDLLIDSDMGHLYDQISYVFVSHVVDNKTGTDLQHAHR